MAALVVTTARQRYVIPFETVDQADAACADAINKLSQEGLLEISNGFMTMFFAKLEIETIQILNHEKPTWLMEQQTMEMVEQQKIRQRAEMALASGLKTF